jgi:hypothetical protein
MRTSSISIVLLAALLQTSAAALATDATSSDADNRDITLGEHNFEIPSRYFLEDGQIPSWLRWIPGLDEGSSELLLTIGASEVTEAVPGFKPKDEGYVDDLRLLIVVLHEYERLRYLDPNRFADIWNGAGSYRDRIVDTDPETGWFRAYRRLEYPYSWEVLKTSPDTPMPNDLFAFWVGHCLNGSSTLTASGSLALCKSYVVVGDIAVHFTVTEQNLKSTDAIRRYLANLISQWLR